MRIKKYKRLPNGYGSIVHLSGKLRNPYLAKSRAGSDPSGRPIYITVGTFPSYAEAFEALINYHKAESPPEVSISFADLFERFRRDVLTQPNNGRLLSASSVSGYGYSFRAVPGLHRRPFLDITAPDLQTALLISPPLVQFSPPPAKLFPLPAPSGPSSRQRFLLFPAHDP